LRARILVVEHDSRVAATLERALSAEGLPILMLTALGTSEEREAAVRQAVGR
jgi:hypothetical protein